MNPQTSRRPITISRGKKLAFASVVVSLFLAVCYFGSCLLVSYQQYSHLKIEGRGWRGTIHTSNPQLGYVAIPDTNGYHTFTNSPDIAMRYDRNGFRVPLDTEDATLGPRPHILTLGCSFTYGDACAAEDTFAWRLADRMGGTALNAGKCSYSLAHMLILGREQIAKFKPDVVVVQYSPWLLDRAMTYYLPAYYGRLPGPYFASNADGKIEVRPPVFSWYAPDFAGYRTTPRGWGDFFSFALSAAIPLKIHDDLGKFSVKVRKVLRLVPPPCKDREKITRAAYQELLDLCADQHAEMIVVVVGMDADPVEVPRALGELNVAIARADEALVAQLSERNDAEYRRAYAHWRGEPPQLVDSHPNARAHAVISQSVYDCLNQHGANVARKPSDRSPRAAFD
jgi:hypothetical protein